MAMNTSVKSCSCDHEYQDQKYGKKQRVHNACKTANSNVTKWRCTVCGSTK